MIWFVKIHPLVLSDDFKTVPKGDKVMILKALNKKLSIDPEAYGKALVGDFKGLWRLRIGDYRVAYQIYKSEVLVFVIKVGIRKDDEVYTELGKRLKKI